MARALQDILTELNAVYDPQRQSYNAQIGTLDPQLAEEQKGLEAQKQDSFQQITDQANRRGLFYSGLPIAEEQRYTGQQFLPAVANLRAKYSSQKFGLQDAIAKITADQYNNAYGIRQKELDTEAAERQFREQLAAQERASAAARASAGGGGFSPTFNTGAQQTTPVQRNANVPAANDAGNMFKLIQTLRQSEGGTKQWTWESLAREFQRRGIDVSSGSAADLALNAYFNAGGTATQGGGNTVRGGGGGGGGGF